MTVAGAWTAPMLSTNGKIAKEIATADPTRIVCGTFILPKKGAMTNSPLTLVKSKRKTAA